MGLNLIVAIVFALICVVLILIGMIKKSRMGGYLTIILAMIVIFLIAREFLSSENNQTPGKFSGGPGTPVKFSFPSPRFPKDLQAFLFSFDGSSAHAVSLSKITEDSIEISAGIPSGTYQVVVLDTLSKKHFMVENLEVFRNSVRWPSTPFPNACRITGKVKDVSDSPRKGLIVKIGDTHLGFTNEKGEFYIEDIPAGKHSLQIITPEEESAPTSIDINSFEVSLDEIVFPQPIDELVFCKKITRRTINNVETVVPLDTSSAFSSNVNKVYCFTRIIGAKTRIKIIHNWYWDNKLVQSIPLAVESNNWGTHSLKTIDPSLTGNWRVDVAKEDSVVLSSKSFVIE
jgi:hypothetical protein